MLTVWCIAAFFQFSIQKNVITTFISAVRALSCWVEEVTKLLCQLQKKKKKDTLILTIKFISFYQLHIRILHIAVRTAERIIGVHLPSLQDLYYSRVKKRAGNIITDPSHPGHDLFALLPSGRRLWQAVLTFISSQDMCFWYQQLNFH